MVTNRELRERAEELAAELGIEISTDRMNHVALTELVARLEGQREAKGTDAPVTPAATGAVRAAPAADERAVPVAKPRPTVERKAAAKPAPTLTVDGAADAAEGGLPKPKPPQPEAKQRYPYTVAPGKTIQCPRGDIRAGREIRARDLVYDTKDIAKGEKALAEFVARGVVVRA
jgi:hypothetical protein